MFQWLLKSWNVVKYWFLTSISSIEKKMLNYLWVLPAVEELIKNASKKKFSHATSQVLFKQTKRQTTKKPQGARQHRHLRTCQALCWRAIPQPWKPRLDSAHNIKSFPLPHPKSLIPQSGKCCWELKWWTSSATSHPACIHSWSFSASQIFLLLLTALTF